MALALPTTDEVHKTAVAELKARLPGASVKELPQVRDLWGCFAERYLGEWMPVASSSYEFSRQAAASDTPPVWSIERRTQFDGHLHVRGTLRFVVDRSKDGQARRASVEARAIADQLAACGEIHDIMLVREPDTDVPFGSTVHVMLLTHVESHFRNDIRIDDRGVPWLNDTTLKVREIVLDYLCYGWSVLRIFNEHGGVIPLGKIHSAFTYFDNHRIEVLKEIEEADQYASELRQQMGQPPAVQKLLAQRK